MSDKAFVLLMHVIVLFTAFPIHEFAHGYVAYKLGDNTAKYSGRLTINPFAHLDLFGTILMVFAGIGWAKPVPINPNNFTKVSRKTGMALTALAGPVSNLLMAYIGMILYKVLYYSVGASTNIAYVELILYYVVVLNIGLAIFNLLPIPPLDGSRVFSVFLDERTYFNIMRYERYIFIGLILVMNSGIFDNFLSFLRSGMFSIMNFLTGYIDLIFA